MYILNFAVINKEWSQTTLIDLYLSNRFEMILISNFKKWIKNACIEGHIYKNQLQCMLQLSFQLFPD